VKRNDRLGKLQLQPDEPLIPAVSDDVFVPFQSHKGGKVYVPKVVACPVRLTENAQNFPLRPVKPNDAMSVSVADQQPSAVNGEPQSLPEFLNRLSTPSVKDFSDSKTLPVGR
jgi:hypothetical protein